MTKPSFDIEAALQALRDGKDLTGKDGILTLHIPAHGERPFWSNVNTYSGST